MVSVNCVTVSELPSISVSFVKTLPFATVLTLLFSVLLRAVGASFTGVTLIDNEPSVVSAGF